MPNSVLGSPVQIAYAVDDVHAAAARFAATTGAGPFIVVEHIALADVRRADGIETFDHSSAYGQWGEVMVELVQEHGAPLRSRGGLHHLAFMVPDLTAARVECAERGWPEVLWATTASGQEFVFHDALDELGHLVELYEPSPRLLAFYARVRAMATD